jgi:hypothetical protein
MNARLSSNTWWNELIPYVAARLVDWGLWSRMRLDGFYGLGGRGFGYREPSPSNPIGYWTAGADFRCNETDEGVAWLRLQSKSLSNAVTLVYRDHPEFSGEMSARFLGCSRMTLWRRIDTAHDLLLEYFMDRGVGLNPQTEELRRARRSLIAQDA